MIYLMLYLLYLTLAGVSITLFKGSLGYTMLVISQAVVFMMMFMVWKKTYKSKEIKEKVIEQSQVPMKKRKTLVSFGNWGFIILVYLVRDVITMEMPAMQYYIASVLDFALLFFTMYPLVLESNIGFKKSGITKVVLMAIVTVFVSMAFNITYSMFLDFLKIIPESGDSSINQQVVIKLIMDAPFKSFMQITFSAAIMEEWVFRGLGFRTMVHRNRFMAYVVTFIVFSLPHLVSGFMMGSGFSEFAFMPIYGMMGVFFAYAYESTESIYTPMLAHFMNNTLSFVSILFS